MRLEIATGAGGGIVELDRPRGPAQALLLLTHGASGRPDTGEIMAVRAAGLRAGIAVGRITQPFVAAGRRTPPKPDVQDAAWLEIVAAVRRRRGLGAVPLVLGGRSNGARVACRTARAAGAGGVVALAFPLHPPGRPEKTRLAELDAAGVPVLVVQGATDSFGMPPAGADRTVTVVTGDHSLRREPDVIARAVVEFVTSLGARARVAT